MRDQFRGLGFCCGLAMAGVLLLCMAAADTVAANTDSTPEKPQEVGDFSLLDQQGRFHQLRRQHGARAVVLMIGGNGCPIVRQNVAKLQALRQKFGKVQFWMLNANPQDDLASIVAEANEFGIQLPILKDESQMVARSLGVKRTAEVIAISAQDWTIFYRGALDDQMVQGANKPQVNEPYLENALRAFLAKKEVPLARTTAAGCLVHYDWSGEDGAISYAKQVAPILQSKCVSCHSPGNIGPFPLSSYSKVRGMSDQIREELLTRRMPPWSADPHYGVFQEDRSLSPGEVQTLVRWIDAGAPRGDEGDPLAESKAPAAAEGWALGQPDFIVTPSERMKIQATGVVDYITNIVDCPIPGDAWLKGTVVRPDNRKLLHHVIVYLEYPEGYASKDRWEEKWLVGWAPGAKQRLYPEGTGKFIPKGSKLRFQLHYTPYGKEDSDLTELGLYLHSQPPQVPLEMRGVANGDFAIPPQTPDHRALAILDCPRATTIYELAPHMHKRGSWFRFEALYPDGRYETLLSVPRYNFNWQHSYRLAQPKQVPPGTRILCLGGFDNSKSNPDNPDPTKTVHWGDQSFDEMFIGFMAVSETPLASSPKQQQQASVDPR